MILFALPGGEPLARELVRLGSGIAGTVEWRRFPDGETYLRLGSDVGDQRTVVVAQLANPDDQFLRLMFVAEMLRGAGASSVELLAPYLPYMRQDAAFSPGEAVTSEIFADLLSRTFDRVTTVDPHLHRHRSLDEIFTIPCSVGHAAPLLARWIEDNVREPLVLSPDEEGLQWAREVAALVDAPVDGFEKQRTGDRSVELRAPDLSAWRGRHPVLVDDIISTGETIRAAGRALRNAGFDGISCLAVHGLFDDATRLLLEAELGALVTTDTVPGNGTRLKVAPLLAETLAG